MCKEKNLLLGLQILEPLHNKGSVTLFTVVFTKSGVKLMSIVSCDIQPVVVSVTFKKYKPLLLIGLINVIVSLLDDKFSITQNYLTTHNYNCKNCQG